MAALVVALRWTPADYYALTAAERDAIVTEINRRNR